MSLTYTAKNIFKEEDVAESYEKFLVNSLEEVEKRFDGLFNWVNAKILLPNLLWNENLKPPLIRIIDFGIGSGKFTIPHIKTLVEAGVSIQVLGFDNSGYMLKKFKKNADEELGINFPNGKNAFLDSSGGEIGKIEKIILCTKDLNNHQGIIVEINKFLNDKPKREDKRKNATLICFAQVWHYLKKPKGFLEEVIVNTLKDAYILHYEPIYYPKLFDGNFDQTDVSLDFSSESESKSESKKAQLHRRFWMHYFCKRDKIDPYSTRRIKPTELSLCFKWYEKKKFAKIGQYKIPWKKKLAFDNLISLIEKPIFSSHYVKEAPDLAREMEELFKNERDGFEGNFDFGYIGHLFSTREFEERSLFLNVDKVNGKIEEIKNKESVLDAFKPKFPKLRFLFIGIVHINKFKLVLPFELLNLTEIALLDAFLAELTKRKIRSISEIITQEKIDDLFIDFISGKILGERNRNLDKATKKEIEEVVNIMQDEVLEKVPLLKLEKEVRILIFPLFPGYLIESTYLNFIVTIIIGKEEDGDWSLDDLKQIVQTVRGEWRDIFTEEFKEVQRVLQSHTLRSAVAAIMARNMSHNIGSHVLSDLATSGGGDNKFYLYLQQRMDFLARVSTEWPAWAMPLYLNSEILYQFISQEILLDRMVSSENLKREDICFFLDGKEIKEEPVGNGIDDFWVDIPEGPVGMHAFYSIMENFIRNSAKHGNFDSEKKLHIHLKAEDTDKDYYRIKLWDNVSKGDENDIATLVKNIKGKLEKGELVKDSGELESKDWGLKEMAICAAFLQRCKSEELHKKSLSSFLQVNKSGNNTLMYTFQLKKPKLILAIDKEDLLRDNNPGLGIYFSKDLKSEIENGINHQFLVIKDLDNIEDTLSLVKKYLHELPARIIVVPKDNGILRKINEDNLGRRIQVIKEFPEYPTDNKDENWKNFILDVYKTWVRKTGNIEQNSKVRLILFLQMGDQDATVRKWNDIKEELNNDNLIDLEVFNCANLIRGQLPDELWGTILEKISSSQKVVVIDNHGKIKKKVISEINKKQNEDSIKKIIQLQVIDKESLTLFNLIQNLPSGFPAKLFLFKIIESALFRILIVDERVAGATFNESGEAFLDTKRYNLKLIGCETATVAKMDKVSLPLSKKAAEALSFLESAKPFDVQRTIDFKGMKMEVGNSSNPFLNNVESVWPTDKELRSYDIILIHQGVIEKLGIEGSVEDWIDKIREVIPYVFVDSGRGKPENLPKNVKYIEYSTIGQFAIQEPSKFHLISALFSISGKERKDE